MKTYRYPHGHLNHWVHALFIELHDYPEGAPLLKKHQTQFRHFDAAKHTSTVVKF